MTSRRPSDPGIGGAALTVGTVGAEPVDAEPDGGGGGPVDAEPDDDDGQGGEPDDQLDGGAPGGGGADDFGLHGGVSPSYFAGGR